jgi:hypothetical protein
VCVCTDVGYSILVATVKEVCVCVCVCVCVYSRFRSLRCCSIKKLRLPFLAFLSKAAKKLRASRSQAKKLVEKIRLVFLPMSPVS